MTTLNKANAHRAMTEAIWCDDCEKWMPMHLFLKHWHEIEPYNPDVMAETIMRGRD